MLVFEGDQVIKKLFIRQCVLFYIWIFDRFVLFRLRFVTKDIIDIILGQRVSLPQYFYGCCSGIAAGHEGLGCFADGSFEDAGDHYVCAISDGVVFI